MRIAFMVSWFGMIATRPSPQRASVLFAALVGTTACAKVEPSPPVAAAAATAAESKNDDAKTAQGAAPVPSLAAVSSRAGEPERLQHEHVLGHVLFKNPIALIKKVNEQVAPPVAAVVLNEYVIRSQIGAALEGRTAVADHLDFEAPIGCVVSDSTLVKVPITCVLGYKGGGAALVTDLGPKGQQADAKGHLGYFKLGSDDVFIDDLGGHVVLTNHAEILKESKAYVERSLLGRAATLPVDFEGVVYPASAIVRYRDDLAPLVGIFETPQPTPLDDTWPELADVLKKNQGQFMKQWSEAEQIRFGIGIDDAGLVFEGDSFPVAGTDSALLVAQLAGIGASDVSLARFLPSTAWALFASRANLDAFKQPFANELKTTLIKAYANTTHKDPTAVTAAIDAFVAEQAALYLEETAGALVHLPGTTGGIVGVSTLEAGKSGRDAWKAWSAKFTDVAVLGEEAAKKVKWTFTPDAAEYGGTVIDRWEIQPTEEGKQEILRSGDEALKAWDVRTNGFKLVIDRFEWEGRAVFVTVLGDSTAYTHAAINAAQGRGSLQDHAAFAKILASTQGATNVTALDVQGGAQWLRAVLPPAEAAKIPADLGVDLTDVTLVGRTQPTAWSVSLRFSQPFLSKVRETLK